MYYYPFTIAAILMLALSFAVIWAWRNRWVRWAIFASLLCAVPITYYTSIDLLSRPKEVGKEFLYYYTAEAEVKGYYAEAGKGLYLLLWSIDWDGPRHYSYPWDENTMELARQLQIIWEEAQRFGVPVLMDRPFNPSVTDGSKPVFRHPAPPKPLPRKDSVQPQKKQFKEYQI